MNKEEPLFTDKKIPRTVYLPESMWAMIDERCMYQNRKASAQIQHMLTKQVQSEMKSNEEAVIMAAQGAKNLKSQQSSGSDDPSLPRQEAT